MFDPARLVFIDETCTNTAMVRLRGRAPRGERLVDYAPQGHWKTITFVGGLRQRAMTAPSVLAATTHMLCCSCGAYFSTAASSENDHGSMNLASNTASLPWTRPSSVAAIQRSAGWKTLRWISVMT